MKIGSKEYQITSCDYAFNRNSDAKGKPASDVYGGTLNISLTSTEDTSLFEAMVNSKHKHFDGTITLYKTDEDAKMKEITFTKSYIVAYAETFSNGNSMDTMITITAEIIKVGSAEHDNEWPTS